MLPCWKNLSGYIRNFSFYHTCVISKYILYTHILQQYISLLNKMKISNNDDGFFGNISVNMYVRKNEMEEERNVYKLSRLKCRY